MIEHDISCYSNNRLFEPTISVLKNAILVNYKKVGSRYMAALAALPNTETDNRKTLDLQFSKKLWLCDDSDDEFTPELCTYSHLALGWKQLDVINNFDLNKYFQANHNLDMFSEFKSTSEFFSYVNSKNYQELFFDNKERDVVYIVRNPIERFVSGITQIITVILPRIQTDSELREDIKYHTKLDDSNLKNVMRYSDTNRIHEIEKNLQMDSLLKIYEYLIEKRWDLIFQDIHTENYLSNYVELIQNTTNKSKVKVINLSECRTNKSLDFFCELRGDDILRDMWQEFDRKQESNKILYNIFVEKYINDIQKWHSLSMSSYLKSEIQHYESLINSPYYVDLKD